MNLIEQYLKYVEITEPPYGFHRWCVITSVGALLGRNFYFQHGHFKVFPNLYTMLVGGAGTRKSTAIKLSQKIITIAGYDTFAADKTSKEKFLVDLAGIDSEIDLSGRSGNIDAITAENLWGTDGLKTPRETFIVADEFNEFAGAGNIEFYSLLGSLWDWDKETPYTHRLKNSKSLNIYQPTISVLGGNTPENFSRAFPPEIIGQGFLSRLILVHGVKSARKYTFPPAPSDADTANLVRTMQVIRSTAVGKASITEDAATILDIIYKGWEELDDIRFRSYSNRRFTQLLKLCLILAASRNSITITEEVVIEANTVLFAVEANFSTALGEFGKSKNSDVANKIMDMLEKADAPVTQKALWKEVHKDLEKPQHMHDIIQGLIGAEKIQTLGSKGYLARRVAKKKPEWINTDLLTTEEKELIGS